MARAKGKPARRGSGGGAARSRFAGLLRGLVALVIVVLLVAATWAARRPILTGAGHLLTVRDSLRRADAILMMSGDFDVRPEEVARIYKLGYAPRVVLVREKDSPAVRLGVVPNTSDAAVAVMRRLGVPQSAILVLRFPGGAGSTDDESRAFREWAYNARPKTVIAVTSAFHSRRSRWLLRRQLDRLDVTVLMDGTPDWEYNESNWWQNKRGLVSYVEEYIKFVHDWTRD